MIQSAGLIFDTLQPESFDMPFGFYTGAGVIFGNSGGVTEAVLRYAAEKVTGKKLEQVEFQQVRGDSGLREANHRRQRHRAQAGHRPRTAQCPCGRGTGEGGQEPLRPDRSDGLPRRMRRRRGTAGDHFDPTRARCAPRASTTRTRCCNCTSRRTTSSSRNATAKFLGEIGGEKAHHLLHTIYQSRRRIADEISSADAAGGSRQDTK